MEAVSLEDALFMAVDIMDTTADTMGTDTITAGCGIRGSSVSVGHIHGTDIPTMDILTMVTPTTAIRMEVVATVGITATRTAAARAMDMAMVMVQE